MKNTITMVNYLVSLLFIICINLVRCETDTFNFRTCGDCISSYEPERCVWCSKDEFYDRRCRPLSYMDTTESWCTGGVVDPPSTVTVKQDIVFGAKKDGLEVQLRPQLIKLKARPGTEMNFRMSFKPAKDYPLDVYYLMDISETMRRKVADFKDQVLQIYNDLTAYTNNVRMGIGSFNLNTPANHSLFKNEVSLTYDITKFKSKIDNIEFASNFRDPVGGLDALMQAMKCQNEVGWRTGARRIIVLFTDSTYHSAGDGQIVGATKPNDMQCHLKDNMYSEALTYDYDYPSISQINQAALDGNFRIIFVITENFSTRITPETEYRELANQIDGAKYAKLEDGIFVINIIKQTYEELANSIKLKFQAPPFVEVTIDQECELEPKRNCESPHRQAVSIPVTLKFKSCPPNDASNQTYNVVVNPSGLADKLTIELEVDCKCDCEKTEGATTPGSCHNFR